MKIQSYKNNKSKETYIINTTKLKDLVRFTDKNEGYNPYRNICKDNESFELDCYENDYEYLLNSELEIETNNYNGTTLLIKRKTEDNQVLIKFGVFTVYSSRVTNNNKHHKRSLSYITNDALIEKNIINKNNYSNEEILRHFIKVINNMDINNSLKETYIGYFKNIEDIKKLMPILYFNEKENKKQWYVPNAIQDKDYFFDYETQIPVLYNNSNIMNSEILFFTILNKNNLECYCKNRGENKNITLKLETDEFDKNEFYFNSNLKKDNSTILKGNQLFNSYDFFDNDTKQNYTFYLPTVQTLEEKETMDFLKKCNSNYTINDIKQEIKKYEYINKEFNCKENTEFNIPFISKKYKIFNDNHYNNDVLDNSFSEISNFSFLKSKEFYLSNYKISSKSLEYSNIELLKSYGDSFFIEKGKKETDLNYIKTKKMDIFLPKYKDFYINEETNNFSKIFEIFSSDKIILILEDNKIIATKKDKFGSIVFETDCKEFKLKETTIPNSDKKSYKAFATGKDKDLFLLHNTNNDIYLLDLNIKDFIVLENSKTFNKLSEELIDLLNFEKRINDSNNFDVFVTDNGLKYFQKRLPFKKMIIKDQEYVPFEFFETKLNIENESYKYKIKIPLDYQGEKLLYRKNSELGQSLVYNIKKDDIKLIEEKKLNINYKIIEIEYEFDKNFINLNESLKSYLEDVKQKTINKNYKEFYFSNNMEKSIKHYRDFENYLISLTINGIKYNKKESLDFLNRFSLLKEKEFVIVDDEITSTINITEKSKLIDENSINNKYFLIHNKKDKKNLSIYDEKNKYTTAFIKKFKNGEMTYKTNYNFKLNKYVIFQKDKMYLFSPFKEIIEFNSCFETNQKNNNSIINNGNTLNFYNEKKELMEFELSQNKEIRKIKNIDGLKTINNKLKDISNSFF